MIAGEVTSNEDNLKTLFWPKTFVAVPRIGDFIRSISGGAIGKVVTVTHCINAIDIPYVRIYVTGML